MEVWMIILICLASVIFLVAALFVITIEVVVRTVLGRYKNNESEEARAKWREWFGIDKDWFDDKKVDDCTIKSFDGIDLFAYAIRNKSDAKIAILQHGYHATPLSMQRHAKYFYERGYTVLLPAARGHGKSGGKFIGMAWLDRFDFARWIDFAHKTYSPQEVIIGGVSMGAATVAAVSGMDGVGDFDAAFCDCGFSSQAREYSFMIKHAKKFCLFLLNCGVRLHCGYSIYDADIKPLVSNAKVPMLFIHGETDPVIDIEESRILYEACGSKDKNFVAVPNTEHARAIVTDESGFAAALDALLEKV